MMVLCLQALAKQRHEDAKRKSSQLTSADVASSVRPKRFHVSERNVSRQERVAKFVRSPCYFPNWFVRTLKPMFLDGFKRIPARISTCYFTTVRRIRWTKPSFSRPCWTALRPKMMAIEPLLLLVTASFVCSA